MDSDTTATTWRRSAGAIHALVGLGVLLMAFTGAAGAVSKPRDVTATQTLGMLFAGGQLEIVHRIVEIEDGGSPRSGGVRLAALCRRLENHHEEKVSEDALCWQVAHVAAVGQDQSAEGAAHSTAGGGAFEGHLRSRSDGT